MIRPPAALCVPVAMPPELCAIDDELKAIYQGEDSVCVWVFATRDERNAFVDATAGMNKAAREAFFDAHCAGRD